MTEVLQVDRADLVAQIKRIAGCIAHDADRSTAELFVLIDELAAHRTAGQAELVEAATWALNFLESAPLESGYCMCGDPVEGHGMHSGHSPVDDLAYGAGQVADCLKAALAPLSQPKGEG